jgi:hypothetical protein
MCPRRTLTYESHFWSFEEIDELCRNSPDAAWAFILAAWSEDQSKSVAQNLSAGPLEDLLARHGEAVIERVEAEARSNPSFAFLLGGVWKNQMTDEVWLRVQSGKRSTRLGWSAPLSTNR